MKNNLQGVDQSESEGLEREDVTCQLRSLGTGLTSRLVRSTNEDRESPCDVEHQISQ